jgi:hypothetical protein
LILDLAYEGCLFLLNIGFKNYCFQFHISNS